MYRIRKFTLTDRDQIVIFYTTPFSLMSVKEFFDRGGLVYIKNYFRSDFTIYSIIKHLLSKVNLFGSQDYDIPDDIASLKDCDQDAVDCYMILNGYTKVNLDEVINNEKI